jgi:tripartite-type tricarboxylate transporter receptor subunit TctC
MTHSLARRLLLAGAAAAAAAPARAQGWPTRPVTLLAFAGAGSTSDVLLRLLAERLGPDLGVPIVVDNKPGANGTIAMETVLRAPADGQLLTVISQGTHNFNKVIYPNVSYDPLRDFAPLIPLIEAPNALLVHPASPYRTPQDIVRAARAAPGTITFASGGNGTSHHLSGELMAQMSGTRMVHVPYRTVGQGTTAVMTREVDFAFFNIATAIGPRDAGQVRLIAVSSTRRSGLLPDVPTMAEAGFPGYEMSTWVGLAYRAGVPPAVMQRMHGAVARAMADPAMRAALTRLGVDPMEPASPEAFAAFIAADIRKWHPILRAAGIGAS